MQVFIENYCLLLSSFFGFSLPFYPPLSHTLSLKAPLVPSLPSLNSISIGFSTVSLDLVNPIEMEGNSAQSTISKIALLLQVLIIRSIYQEHN